MDNSLQDILLAFGLTLIAGLSTGIGSLIAFLAKRTNTRFLSTALGLSAGVMMYVSFMELMPESVAEFSKIHSGHAANVWMLLAFFFGIACIACIDWLVPEDENPHEIHTDSTVPQKKLKRTGLMMALAIGIHNFPEGIATFAAGLDSLTLGTSIALAVAVRLR